MKRIVSLFLLLVLVPLASAGPIDSCVFIERTNGQSTNAGSGTVIGNENGRSLILSAAHVVPDQADGVVVVLKGREHKARYLVGSKVTEKQVGPNHIQLTIDGPDLALLTVKDDLPVVEIAKKAPKLKDRLRQWGFAGGDRDKQFFKKGLVLDPDALFGTVDARPGDSGSGLFNDDDLLVGVTSARPASDNEQGVYAVPLNEVRKFVRSKAIGFPTLRESLED